MPSDVKVTSNLKGLDQLQENLKTKLVAKLGIFADDNQRDEKELSIALEKNVKGINQRKSTDLTNAEIGARHEFGVLSEGLPRRSFLKDPIEIKRKELLETANKVIKANIAKEGGAEKIFKLIGIAGEAIVQEAFESGGFGTWKELTDFTVNKKGGSSQILIDSSQLRRSVISKVEKGE